MRSTSQRSRRSVTVTHRAARSTTANSLHGKTKKEALRALKRRITDTIYRQLRADAARKHAGPGGQAGTTHQSSVTGFEPRTPALRKNHSRTRPNARTRPRRTPQPTPTTT